MNLFLEGLWASVRRFFTGDSPPEHRTWEIHVQLNGVSMWRLFDGTYEEAEAEVQRLVTVEFYKSKQLVHCNYEITPKGEAP